MGDVLHLLAATAICVFGLVGFLGIIAAALALFLVGVKYGERFIHWVNR